MSLSEDCVWRILTVMSASGLRILPLLRRSVLDLSTQYAISSTCYINS